MSETIGITVSSQLKSANTEKDIELHSGKKNRGKFKHANEDIDRTRSHLNVEFDLLSRDELLEKHYTPAWNRKQEKTIELFQRSVPPKNRLCQGLKPDWNRRRRRI